MSVVKISIEEPSLRVIELFPCLKESNASHIFECNLCFTSFENCELLKAHLTAELEYGRDADEFLKSEDYEEKFKTPEKQLKVPFQCKDEAKENILCPKCSKKLKSFKGLEQHIAKKHVNIRKKSSCKSCGKYFKDKYAMVFHVKQVHEKSTRVICRICQQTIYNKYSLLVHIERHHSNLPPTESQV